MFSPQQPATFSLTIDSVTNDFKVLAFNGKEAINTPYRFEIEVVSERADIDLEGLLHQPTFLAFDTQGAGVHGQIHSVAQGETGRRLTHYHLVLVPRLAYLAHGRQQRMFQNLSVPQIIAAVLEGHGILADSYRFQCGPTVYPARDYCTQYDETDLNFLQRLCAEEGLSYHFQHSLTQHLLVFGDDQTVFRKLPETAYQPGTGMAAQHAVVSRFGVRVQTRTAQVSRRDYDFQQPHVRLSAEQRVVVADGASAPPPLEDYDYPGEFRDDARGRQLSRRALERHRHDYRLAEGNSDQPALVSGHFLPLTAHPREAWNDLWLLTALTHEGRQPQVLEESATSDTLKDPDGFHQGYRNTFTATPWDAPYRPALEHQRHVIHGSQSATVTGPPGEEVFCDEFGRVKVQFPWQRTGQADEHSSCWLRVATPWAGDRYGSVVIPRIGMEVEVSFFEGDPDRPYVSACLPNSTNPVPYPLPATKTQSVFKSSSTPGGRGFNEVRIEDKKGSEEIFVHAERDWSQIVKHDHSLHVGNERRTTVGANCITELKAEERRITHGERKVAVKASDHLDTTLNRHVKTGTGMFFEAGREIHFKAGEKVVIEAETELSINTPAGFLKIDPSGVWLNGVLVGLNSGGYAGQGAGTALEMPLALNLPSLTNAGINSISLSKPSSLAEKPMTAQRLHSTFALDQLTDIARGSTPTEFTLMLVPIFGYDIPAKTYIKLHAALNEGSVENPKHRVMDIGDYPASYDNATRTINVHHVAIKSAHEQPDEARRLLAILLHEFGHHIDNVLRTDLSDKHPDGSSTLAEDGLLDEGARYAYRIAFFDIENSHETIYAHYTSANYDGPLKVDYREAQAAIQRSQRADAQEQEYKSGSREGFGAGRGEHHEEKPGSSFGHESIGDALEKVGFTALQRKAIYFGNWLRDYSQLLDPKIVRAQTAPMDFPSKLSREVITNAVNLLAKKEFYSLRKTKNGPEDYTVTKKMLGVYRPSEHIDNPKNLKPDPADPQAIDPEFEPWVLPGDPLLDILPKRSMKGYIRNSEAYMHKQLQKAAAAGPTAKGMRWFGEALHVLEDYFAHSNYVELSLRKLGHNKVLPWTSKTDCKHGWPVVTGMFNSSDVIASLAEPLAKMLFPVRNDFEASIPGERSDAEEMMLILLEDHSDPRWKERLEALLAARDKWAAMPGHQYVEKAGWIVGTPLRLYINANNMAFQALLQLIGNSVDDAQTLLEEDHNTSGSTDPSHSQLAKDHDNHPFHALAAQLAGHAVEQVGAAMYRRWKGDTASDPATLASSFICHPNDSTWQDAIVSNWAKSHPKEILQGASATDLEHLHETHAKPALERIKQIGSRGKENWNYINKHYLDLFGERSQIK
jgi:type VI secretion system secreted protein VgrG